ncbi:hypothetical protein HAX54_008694 [Datura stramonium]|uniref:Uncharacterized protein n=1 Tax=Datura stramonium TaxID=4076 RepID=A0ABS8TF41_DATST|nr:hypothetical protein [Datura stramonium]
MVYVQQKKGTKQVNRLDKEQHKSKKARSSRPTLSTASTLPKGPGMINKVIESLPDAGQKAGGSVTRSDNATLVPTVPPHGTLARQGKGVNRGDGQNHLYA